MAHSSARVAGFVAVYDVFGTIAAELAAYSDMIAERIAALGGTACVRAQPASQRSPPVAYAPGAADAQRQALAVSAALAGFADMVRHTAGQAQAIGDADTAHLLTKVSRGIDHQLWVTESCRARQSNPNKR